jgi:1-acyl-sn-glycerol-3-phosphate acyltransferase
MLYRAIRFVIGGATDVFYRRQHLGGSVPARGPVLLVANHPNGLIDPAAVANLVDRPVRMLGKAPLFRMPVVSWLVRGVGALPVYRQKDGADTAQNRDTFTAVDSALKNGEVVLIFPEGISHDAPQLQPLKTGAARMALSARDSGLNDVMVVPIGLTYRDKERFRSELATDIGAPLTVQASDDVRSLTERIDTALRAVTMNLDAWDDVPLLDAVDAIWRIGDTNRAARLKELADGVALLRAHAPKELAQARQAVVEWTTRLQQLGLSPRDLQLMPLTARASPRSVARFVLRTVLHLIAFPASAFGALWFLVPFWLVHLVWLLARTTRDLAGTVKVLASIVFFPPWHALMTFWVWSAAGGTAALLCGTIAPFSGMTSRWFFRGRARALRDGVMAVRLMFSGPVDRALESERAELVRRFDALSARVNELRAGSR